MLFCGESVRLFGKPSCSVARAGAILKFSPMKTLRQQISPFRPAASASSGVALLLAFVLATHVFWCSLAAPPCESGRALVGASIASQIVTHHHLDADICAGMDEAKSRISAAVSPFVAPVLLWGALVFLAATLNLTALFQCAQVFGRDGPVSVPPLFSRLMRASLPHRAPPVFLI